MGQTVEFPVENIIAPGLFTTKRQVGEKVWFIAKNGAWVEGKVVSFIVAVVPQPKPEGSETKPTPANVQEVNYLIQYIIPGGSPEGQWVAKVDVMSNDSLFDSFEDLLASWKENATYQYPEEDGQKE